MSQNMFNEKCLTFKINRCDQAVIVSLDVKDKAAVNLIGFRPSLSNVV